MIEFEIEGEVIEVVVVEYFDWETQAWVPSV